MPLQHVSGTRMELIRVVTLKSWKEQWYHEKFDRFGDSRRRFLRTLVRGRAAPLCVPSFFKIDAARAAQQSDINHRRFVLREDRFGRIFPQLPPFAEPSQRLSEALLKIGKPRGHYGRQR